MKKLIILLLFIPLLSFGQKSNDTDALKLCVALQSNNFTSDAEAEDAVNKILSVIGASQKPVLQACSNINNAVAAVYKGQRYILYDRMFMNSLTAGSNKYWSNMFILAHEMGHHINGHSLDIILYANDVIDPKSLEERRLQELEADEFAGFVLSKLGASFEQASKIMQNLPSISNENSSTHPSILNRVSAIKNGYNKNNSTFKNQNINNNYSIISERNNKKILNSWDFVNEDPKTDYLKDINDPFERLKIIKDDDIPDKKITSWIYGNVVNEEVFENPNLVINTKPKFTIVQEKNDNQVFDHNNIEIYIQNLIEYETISQNPTIKNWLNKDVRHPVSLATIYFDYVFDDGDTGYFELDMDLSEDNWSVFLDWNGSNYNDLKNNYLNFIKKLKNKKKFFVKIKEVEIHYPIDEILLSELNKNFFTYVFDLRGSSKALSF